MCLCLCLCTLVCTVTHAFRVCACDLQMDSADISAASVVDDGDASFVIPFGDLHLGRRIGAGAFSTVYEGVLRGATPVAIKALKGSPDLLVFLKKELEVLKYVLCAAGPSSSRRSRAWSALGLAVVAHLLDRRAGLR